MNKQKTFYLFRGLPGSGKSTIAQALFHSPEINFTSVAWFEADQYFIDPRTGEYKYQSELIGKAHAWCQACCHEAMEKEVSSILISNTFCQRWEAEPYFQMAHQFGYQVQVIYCQGRFGSIHNIPEESYNRMKARFEHDIC